MELSGLPERARRRLSCGAVGGSMWRRFAMKREKERGTVTGRKRHRDREAERWKQNLAQGERCNN